jgi:hypothetical protein
MTDTLLALVEVLAWLYAPLLAGGVVAGLYYVTRPRPSDGPDEDGPPGGSDAPDPPEPMPPAWDWERFERDLRDYSRQVAHR